MRIGIDLDEVVADSLTGIIAFHNKKYGTTLKKEDFHSYDFWETWGGTPEEAAEKVYEFFATDQLATVDHIAGSMEALAELKKQGHNLYIITGRSDDLVRETEEWVETKFPKVFSGIHFANLYTFDGRACLKSELCKELNIDILIDDQPANVYDCATKGIRVFLFDQAWNREAILPAGAERVLSWSEILKRIED